MADLEPDRFKCLEDIYTAIRETRIGSRQTAGSSHQDIGNHGRTASQRTINGENHALLNWQIWRPDANRIAQSLETRNYLTSGPEIFGSKPRALQLGICASPERSMLARTAFAFLVVFTVMFFVSFSNPAYAHGMHGTNAAQLSELSVEVAVPGTDAIMEKASDAAMGGCGTNCCSMSGCGYASLQLPRLFSPNPSAGLGYLFSYLPWVKNPLDSLQRPPRSFS